MLENEEKKSNGRVESLNIKHLPTIFIHTFDT